MAHRSDQIPAQGRLLLVAIAFLLAPAIAFGSTPELDIFAVPDEGEGPLEVKLVVRAMNTDPNTLFCKLSLRGDDGPFDSHHYFTLEPPYPKEVVFTHVYPAADQDYRPTIRCQDEGIATVSGPVTVHDAIGNGKPEAAVTGPAVPGDAADPVQFKVDVFDPDGAPLTCTLDFGEFGVDPVEMTIAAPYNRRTFQHTYSRPSVNGGGYHAQILCNDPDGSSALGTFTTDVVMSPGNTSPSFDLRRLMPQEGEAPRDVDFRLRSIIDSGSDVLDCYFDAKDGLGRRPFTIQPPYTDQFFSARYTEAFELGFPTVSCNDGRGGSFTDNVSLIVHKSPDNRDPVITIDPSTGSGSSPLTVSFDIRARDDDGDPLRCTLSYGIGQETETFTTVAPYPTMRFQHTFDATNSYQVSVECAEDHGGRARSAEWIYADPYHSPGNYDPVMRVQSTPSAGIAPLGVSFFVTGSDPDGDDVICDLDFGDGTNVRTAVLEAPLYTQEWVTHTFFTAASTPYPVRMICRDSKGGETTKTLAIQVDRDTENDKPVVRQFALSSQSGVAPLNVSFDITVNDTDSSVLSCVLDYGDGNSSNWRMSTPLTVSPSHVYEAGSYQARLYCCDDVVAGGICQPDNVGVVTSTRSVFVSAVNRAPSLTLTASASSGVVPLNVTVAIDATDPDNDPLTCQMRTSLNKSVQVIGVGAPYPTVHLAALIDVAGDYDLIVTCDDGKGQATAASVPVSVQWPGGSFKDNPTGSDGPTDSGSTMPRNR